ncbi:MAG: dihydropyrimidinase [Eubacteriales bacterium]|nr:dihydropyrimidinase [Eubacteriales bacterium]
MKTLLKNGTVVLEDGAKRQDLLIEDGKIAEIAEAISVEADEVVDVEGCYVFPGFIDPHVHMQMTNALTTTADSYETGTKAAIHGGTTTIINFATAEPGMSLHDVLAREKSKADDVSSCHYLFHCEMVDVNENTLRELKEISEAGCRSVKIYLAYTFRIGDHDMYRCIAACRDANLLLEAHCENGAMLDGVLEDLIARGETAIAYKAKAHPPEAEADSVATMGRMAGLLGAHVHVVHLSSRLGLEELRHLRAEGVEITAETCPQYLYLDESVYANEDHLMAAKYVCAPPPRTARDQAAILEGLVNGEIQTAATDHCAYCVDGQKSMSTEDFRRTPGGIPGVEERAQLFYTKLLAPGLITPEAFADLMATNSAKLYQLYPQKGVLRVGSDADITVYDPAVRERLTADHLHSAAKNTVYEGVEVEGKTRHVFLDGQWVLKDGELQIEKQGRFLATPRSPEQNQHWDLIKR